MTQPKGAHRRRVAHVGIRPSGLPAPVADWFARGGEGPTPWEALLAPDVGRMPAWWREWSKGRRGAVPPAVPWIDWTIHDD